ncbi:hypothetical protein [Microbacterium sp.]|uniref:hypothetical protein n=1 Tax=Microbacterium sp. TaxID=51671 RepID=UPI003F94E766
MTVGDWEEDARNLLIEWIKPSTAGLSPLDRQGAEWWRTAFNKTGPIKARLFQYNDGRTNAWHVSPLAQPPQPPLYRVQPRHAQPKWSWWNSLEWAQQHLLLIDTPGTCIMRASAINHVYATITHERQTLDGRIETGFAEVICEVTEWKRFQDPTSIAEQFTATSAAYAVRAVKT